MDYKKYQELFRKKAIDAGYSEDNIIKCLSYAEKLISRKLPVIYNSSHLAALVGYKRSYIKRAIYHTKYFYRTFSIKKKNGKKREISEPLPSLKEIQDWILNNILYIRKNNRFAKAYIPQKTIVDNIKFHINQPIVLCVDIQDFFHSITLQSVQEIFVEFGYSLRVAEVLAKLCCLEGHLPQGAPTSPQLSNIYMHSFDTSVAKYCVNKQIRYTRYADDLTFSGNFDDIEVLSFVSQNLNAIGLKINPEKTKVMTSNMRQIITGIVVNKKAQIPKEKRRELRQAIYYIKKFGLESHLEKVQCNKSNYLKHLLGIANYFLFINPNDNTLKEEKKYLIDLYKQQKR
jgi:RNA-directed DNA polymerase